MEMMVVGPVAASGTAPPGDFRAPGDQRLAGREYASGPLQGAPMSRTNLSLLAVVIVSAAGLACAPGSGEDQGGQDGSSMGGAGGTGGTGQGNGGSTGGGGG